MNKSDQTSPANLTVIPVTAAIGIQAPLFVYVAIARYGRQSSYLLLLTLAVWVLATATMWVAYRIIFVTYGVNYQRQGLPSCGNYDLSDFCYALDLYTGFSSGSLNYLMWIWFMVWFLIWGLSALVLFTAIASWIQLTKFPRLRTLTTLLNPMGSGYRRTNFMRFKWSKAWEYLNPEAERDSWLFYAVTGLLAGSLFVELYQVGYIWKLNLEDASNWTFGQIVAVLAWAAPLMEFVNLTISMQFLSASASSHAVCCLS